MGLASSKIELFPHQVEVVRRVLQDPVVRYLLADEVGLGKTIEAGAILRQLRLDSPQMPINVFAPEVLVQQWCNELADRFDLRDVEVESHSQISKFQSTGGVVVIDEAHRVLGSASRDSVARATKPELTPYLLLLSATPILHHEQQLFDLLNLLDPYGYPAGSFEQFRLRITRRRDLGRALLALSRSTRPAFIVRHAQRCADLLPEDKYVREAAAACRDAAGSELAQEVLMRNASSLRIDITETYRIHRRLIRTRREALFAEGDMLQVRREEPPIYSGQDSLFIELWQTIEEWRTKAAAHVANCGVTDPWRWIQLYLEIVHRAAVDPATLGTIFISEPHGISFPGDESVIELLQEIGMRIGNDGARHVVRRFCREHGNEGRWVVFCGDSKYCHRFAQLFEEEWDGQSFLHPCNGRYDRIPTALWISRF